MNPPTPNLWVAAQQAQALFNRLDLENCVIGGLANQRWGEPRITRDVDFTLLAGFGNESHVIQKLLRDLTPRFEDAAEFALHSRVLLVEDKHGTPLDIALAALPFEENIVQRATPWTIGDRDEVVTCSAEDLIVLKAFASRPQDWIDIEGVIIRQGSVLNQKLIMTELTPLTELKEEPEILVELQQLFRTHNV